MLDPYVQVITVMFDRSKFNEDEARYWWEMNGLCVMSYGAL